MELVEAVAVVQEVARVEAAAAMAAMAAEAMAAMVARVANQEVGMVVLEVTVAREVMVALVDSKSVSRLHS